jgi:murein DD-endopeptidase MepM/ murein hydrolase activator NlpD
MDKRKLFVSILAGIMALVMILGLIAGFLPTPVSAATSSKELKKQLEGLKDDKAAIDAEIKTLKGKIKNNNGEIKEMVEQKDLIDQEIALLYKQIDNINEQISTYSLMIADKQEQLDAAQTKFDDLTVRNKERIQAMEEDGDLSYWSVLFQANNFSDLLDRLNMVQEIAASDRRRLEALDAAAKEVAETKAEMEAEKAELETSKVELEEIQVELEAKRVEADELLSDLVAKGMEYDAYMEESEDLQEKLMKDIANTKDKYDKAKYQEWLATSVPPTTKPKKPSPGRGGSSSTVNTVGGVKWKTPMTYTAFTSPFGWRTHPVYGGRRFHYGVDLAAPTGTKIYATRAGTVDTASYQAGGAGNYVQINHGDGYRSVYMHMTRYVVKVGQHVSQGQLIGYCGSTGGSTGPHLHFGISYNGTYVNPANYIKI